ncbi:MAG: ATP-binding protein [Gemmatimonadaceae bacterium]
MQPIDLDLNAVVASLTKMLQRVLGEDIQLQLLLHPRPLITRVDASMLDQALMNLVINARDAMPGGGRLIVATDERVLTADEARLIADASPGTYVSVRVTDTGRGIAPDALPHIFEPFFTTKEPGKGTGLGLATVFGIVRQHGGTIRAESVVDRGTMFELLLPKSTASHLAPVLPQDVTPWVGVPRPFLSSKMSPPSASRRVPCSRCRDTTCSRRPMASKLCAFGTSIRAPSTCC